VRGLGAWYNVVRIAGAPHARLGAPAQEVVMTTVGTGKYRYALTEN